MTAWSFSRLQVYRACPAQFKYRYLLKLPEPPSAPMERGNVIHGTLEKFINLKGAKTVKLGELGKLKPRLAEILKGQPRAEMQLAFDPKWKPVDWFDQSVRVRVKVDVAYTVSPGVLEVLDYKSGKIKPEEHAEQLELYGLGYMILQPELDVIKTGVWYVDYEEEPRELGIYERPFTGHVRALKQSWNKKAAALVADTKFKPTPSSRACGWCAFSCRKAVNGKAGPCQDAA